MKLNKTSVQSDQSIFKSPTSEIFNFETQLRMMGQESPKAFQEVKITDIQLKPVVKEIDEKVYKRLGRNIKSQKHLEFTKNIPKLKEFKILPQNFGWRKSDDYFMIHKKVAPKFKRIKSAKVFKTTFKVIEKEGIPIDERLEKIRLPNKPINVPTERIKVSPQVKTQEKFVKNQTNKIKIKSKFLQKQEEKKAIVAQTLEQPPVLITLPQKKHTRENSDIRDQTQIDKIIIPTVPDSIQPSFQKTKAVWDIQQDFMKTQRQIDKRFKLTQSLKKLPENMSKYMKQKILKDLQEFRSYNQGNLPQKLESEKQLLKNKRKTPDIVDQIMKKSKSQPMNKLQKSVSLSRLIFYDKKAAIKLQQELRQKNLRSQNKSKVQITQKNENLFEKLGFVDPNRDEKIRKQYENLKIVKLKPQNIRNAYAKSVEFDQKLQSRKKSTLVNFFYVNKNIKHNPDKCFEMLKNPQQFDDKQYNKKQATIFDIKRKSTETNLCSTLYTPQSLTIKNFTAAVSGETSTKLGHTERSLKQIKLELQDFFGKKNQKICANKKSPQIFQIQKLQQNMKTSSMQQLDLLQSVNHRRLQGLIRPKSQHGRIMTARTKEAQTDMFNINFQKSTSDFESEEEILETTQDKLTRFVQFEELLNKQI